MKTARILTTLVLLGLLIFATPNTFLVSARADTADSPPLAVVVSSASQVEWQIQIENNGADLILFGPNGLVFEKSFPAGVKPVFALVDESGLRRSVGSYAYELRVRPLIDPDVQAQLEAVRGTAQESAVREELEQSGEMPQGPFTQSGSFWLPEGSTPAITSSPYAASNRTDNTMSMMDVVTPDDSIVQGSLCVGFDCVLDENFGFDTVRLKENNTRIKFEDTSSTTGFPTHDWQLTANDAPSGGMERFIIEDVTAATMPFSIMGSAPTNAMVIGSNGKLGLRTITPVLDVHMVTVDTPAIRFEQTNAGGYTAQTWDIGANEANFFVRDLTGGSRLPFRIRPGAPTSSIDISASGNVGIGTASPQAKLDVRGNILVEGYVSERSDKNAKSNFAAVDGKSILGLLKEVPVLTWNYTDDPDAFRHMGPMAQDFYAAFGLGVDDKHLGALDTNGVALAAIQELNRQVEEKDAKISSLEARIAALEVRQPGSLLANLTPLALGLLGLAAGLRIARKRSLF